MTRTSVFSWLSCKTKNPAIHDLMSTTHFSRPCVIRRHGNVKVLIICITYYCHVSCWRHQVSACKGQKGEDLKSTLEGHPIRFIAHHWMLLAKTGINPVKNSTRYANQAEKTIKNYSMVNSVESCTCWTKADLILSISSLNWTANSSYLSLDD